jgi:hypothetical protein
MASPGQIAVTEITVSTKVGFSINKKLWVLGLYKNIAERIYL